MAYRKDILIPYIKANEEWKKFVSEWEKENKETELISKQGEK